MGSRSEDGTPSPIEAAVVERYGPEQKIEGLPEKFAFFGHGTHGGVLFHRLCEGVIDQFGEQAVRAAIVQAANHHRCSRMSGGAGVG